jgi:hypothetical protein
VKPFCIIGTPRSRTTWLSKFLTYEDVVCEHDPSMQFKELRDIPAYFKANRGAVDSGLTFLWRNVVAVPQIKVLAIKRPYDEVRASFKRIKIEDIPDMVFTRYEAAFDAMKYEVPIFSYSSLFDPVVVKKVFKWAIGEDCPDAWYERWTSTYVQPDISMLVAAAKKNLDGIRQLYGE